MDIHFLKKINSEAKTFQKYIKLFTIASIFIIISISCTRFRNNKSDSKDSTEKEIERLFKNAKQTLEANPRQTLNTIDSIERINKINYTKETEIHALYFKGKCFRIQENKKEAYINIYKSLQKSEEENNTFYKVLNLTELSEIKFNENKYIEADSLLDIAEELAQKHNYQACLSSIYNSKAVIADYTGQKTKAIQLFLKTLEFYKRENNEKSQAVIYNNIGLLYTSINNNKESLKFLKIALMLNKKNNFKDGLAESYNNLGIVYKEMDSIVKGLEAYKFSLSLYKQLDRTPDLAKIYLNIANLLSENKEFSQAKNYYDSSLVICKQYNIEVGIILNEINYGALFAKMGDHQQAIKHLNSGLEKVKKLNLIDYECNTEFLLVKSYKAIGNIQEAFSHLEHYYSIKDSTSGIDINKQIAELQSKYNKVEQESEILQLNQKVLNEKAKNNMMVIIILIISILFIIVWSLLSLRNRKIKFKSKLVQNENEIANLNLELKNKELITNALHLASLTEFSNNLAKQLKYIVENNELPINNSLIDILNQINNAAPIGAWKDFETRFEQVHETFYAKLTQEYPDLSPAEIKICSFLRLNMTTKDISLLTHRSQRTIENQRNSIRKKMNLPADANLESHLLKRH